jgi:hypothetical protein
MPFQKGHDPNRNTAGRPKGSVKKLTKSELEQLNILLGKATGEAVDVIFSIMRDKQGDVKNRFAAAKFVVGTKIQVDQIIERRDRDPDDENGDDAPIVAPVVNLVWENKFSE